MGVHGALGRPWAPASPPGPPLGLPPGGRALERIPPRSDKGSAHGAPGDPGEGGVTRLYGDKEVNIDLKYISNRWDLKIDLNKHHFFIKKLSLHRL